MKKSELERARNAHLNTSVSTDELRLRVSSDLDIVRDAYDLADVFLVELQKQLANVGFADKPGKAAAELARAYSDIVKSVVSLRAEARTTVQYHAEHVAQAEGPAEAGDPPVPAGAAVESGLTQPIKISPSRAGPGEPLALTEYLGSLNPETED